MTTKFNIYEYSCIILSSDSWVKKDQLNPLLMIRILAIMGALMFVAPEKVAGQIKLPEAELNISLFGGSGAQTPFWLLSNHNGKYSLNNNGAIGSIRLFAAPDTTTNFDISYGFELVNRFDGSNKTWLHKAYVRADYLQLFSLKAGMWEQSYSYEYTPLSSGSMLWSSNARPIPRIELGTPGYIEVPYTKGLLAIKGGLANGWMGDERYVEGVLLHQKYIFARAGGKKKLNVTFGFHHVALWGGNSPQYGQLPVDFDSYLRLFLARSGNPDREGTPDIWIINAFGNHIGSRSYAVDYKLSHGRVGVYRQDIFEDGSGGRMKNFPDGLWGIFWEVGAKNSWVEAILYEYLQTTDQSGSSHENDEKILGGDDNYFNHGVYQSGWTHHRMTIGTPFITSPLYYQNIDHGGNHRIWNNRVRVHHLAIMGKLPFDMDYRIRISYGENLGIYGSTISIPSVFVIDQPIVQWSGRADLYYDAPFAGATINLGIAFDKGKMYDDNFGVILGATIPLFNR
jgi:hypothetical protein